MPLPPYITEKLDDRDRYQTVFAKEIGAAAASTQDYILRKTCLDKSRKKGLILPLLLCMLVLGLLDLLSVETY